MNFCSIVRLLLIYVSYSAFVLGEDYLRFILSDWIINSSRKVLIM
jgi:hypothetical protein